jgi:hypothetical protein
MAARVCVSLLRAELAEPNHVPHAVYRDWQTSKQYAHYAHQDKYPDQQPHEGRDMSDFGSNFALVAHSVIPSPSVSVLLLPDLPRTAGRSGVVSRSFF